MGDTTDLTTHGVNSRVMALSNEDAISAQQPTKLYPLLPELVKETETILAPLECTKERYTESNQENYRECCKQKDMPAEMILSKVPKLDYRSSHVPQPAAAPDSNSKVSEDVESDVAVATEISLSNSCEDNRCSHLNEDATIIISSKDQCQKHLQPTMVELDEGFSLQGDFPCHTEENKFPFTNQKTTREAGNPENRNSNLLMINLPSHEDTEAGRYYDQDISSSIGFGKSQNLEGVLEDCKMQTSVRRNGKYTKVTDRLTDELLESLVKEALADSATNPEFRRLSRSTPSYRASGASNASRKSTFSVAPRKKTKDRKNKEFMEVLKHFIPIGWRAVISRHKIGLLLQSELIKNNGPLHHIVLSGADFLHSSTQQTSEVILPVISSKEYIQAYVQKALQLSSLLEDPSPSTWYDAETPIGQDIYEKVMDLQSKLGHGSLELGDWRTQNRILSDLVNESLFAYSATKYKAHLNISFLTDCGKILHFVTSRVVEQVNPLSNRDPDVDKLVRKVMDDEQWGKCAEEVRDLVSELAQGVLCNLIESFVQEMILGMDSVNCSIFSSSVYKNSELVS